MSFGAALLVLAALSLCGGPAAPSGVERSTGTLMEAVWEEAGTGSYPKVRARLQAGADPNEAALDGRALPLHKAAAVGDLQLATMLLAAGADPNREADHTTALHQAARFGRPDVLSLLIESGADLEAAPGTGTPLHTAVWYNQVDCARRLVEAGAKVDPTNDNRKTPLQVTVSKQGSPELVELLLQRGAEVDVRYRDGKTPLHIAVANSVWAYSLPVARMLIAAGAAVDARADSGAQPLHQAVVFGRSPHVVKLLLDHGANPHARDAAGRAPSELAADKQSIAEVFAEHSAAQALTPPDP